MSTIHFQTTNMTTIDPRFQDLYWKTPEHLQNQTVVAVIAKVNRLDLWSRLPNILTCAVIPDRNLHIITARVLLSNVLPIKNQTFVISLKIAYAVRPLLRNTLPDIGLLSSINVTPANHVFNQGGAGVVVGVVDYGGDFAHANFRSLQGRTRLLSLWNQGGVPNQMSPFGYGRDYSQADINTALNTNNPYGYLGYSPGSASHGTHVMDIAAGSGAAPGVAPKTDLVFVELATQSPRTVQGVVTTDFGDSVRVIEAVRYIFAKAGNRPCVVNLSLGTNGGPHDGTNPVEQALDAMVRERPNRAVVIAAGNSYQDRMHQLGQVVLNQNTDIEWNFSSRDRTPNEIEIWYSGQDEFTLQILDSDNQLVATMNLGENGYLYKNERGQRKLVGYVSHRKKDPNNGDNVIHIFQHAPSQWKGPTYHSDFPWTIRLFGKKIQREGKFQAWIERDDHGRSNFGRSQGDFTLGSLSTGHESIVVGSYNARVDGRPISSFSSAGPTRDLREKPEVSAPGSDIFAADSGTFDRTTKMSGTSMAAPVVTGLIARILGFAKARNVNLTIDQIRAILIDSSRKLDETGSWDQRYGFGLVHIQALNHVARRAVEVHAARNENQCAIA